MIAADIMTKEVKTVNLSMKIRELAKFLVAENFSGAPVIDKNGEFLGIVTEEDLIFQDKKIHPPAFLNFFSSVISLGFGQLEDDLEKIAGTKVEDVMQSEPKTITKDTTIEDIATMMTEEKAYYLSVIEDGRIVGVITKRDLITDISKGKIW